MDRIASILTSQCPGRMHSSEAFCSTQNAAPRGIRFVLFMLKLGIVSLPNSVSLDCVHEYASSSKFFSQLPPLVVQSVVAVISLAFCSLTIAIQLPVSMSPFKFTPCAVHFIYAAAFSHLKVVHSSN